MKKLVLSLMAGVSATVLLSQLVLATNIQIPPGSTIELPNGGIAHVPDAPPVDTTPPTLAITDDQTDVAKGPVVLKFSFSEPVVGFDATKVRGDNWTAGPFTQVDSLTYTLAAMPKANSKGTLTIVVDAGAFKDQAGNLNVTQAMFAQPYDTTLPPPVDTTPPTMQVSSNQVGGTSGPTTFSFTFSESVVFDMSMVSVSGGTAGPLVKVDPLTYRMNVTPTSNSKGTMTATVLAGAVKDLAGNANLAGAVASQVYDTTVVVQPPPPGSIPLKSSFVTPAAADYMKSFAYPGIGPSYPKAWTWDLRLPIDHQPQAATAAMNLKPKIEQIRGGKVIATWDNFSTGPFSGGPVPAWRPGDKFKVYPAVYKDAWIATPTQKMPAFSGTTTAGGMTMKVASTVGMAVGDAFFANSALTKYSHIASIDSPTQLTLDKPALTTGAANVILLQPVDLVFEGVTELVNGVPTRPVVSYDDTVSGGPTQGKGVFTTYSGAFGEITNLVFDNIDFEVPEPPLGQRYWQIGDHPWAIFYMGGSQHQGLFRLANMRIHGAMYASDGGNGILDLQSAPDKWEGGTWEIDHVHFFHNGGADGPAHHVYLGEGNFKVKLTHSWMDRGFFGHLFKTRGINNEIVGNFFQGGTLPQGSIYGESNDLDVPCGGRLILKNNIFLRRHNLAATNQFAVMYLEDPKCMMPGGYRWDQVLEQEVDIEHNTWVALGEGTWGGRLSENIPLWFWGYPLDSGLYPASKTERSGAPSDPWFPTKKLIFKNNVFAGYNPTGRSGLPTWMTDDFAHGVGPNLQVAFTDLNQDWSLNANYVPESGSSIVGTDAYAHEASGVTRQLTTFGARDAAAGNATTPLVPEFPFYADAYQVPTGSGTTLRWSATGATGCTASDGWSGAKAIQSQEKIASINVGAENKFTLTCTGPLGSNSETVTIQAVDKPVLDSFTANLQSVAKGQPVTFSWGSHNAESCMPADALGVGWFAMGAHGSMTVNPIQTAVYALRCKGLAGQSDWQKVRVDVPGTLPQPTVNVWLDLNGGYLQTHLGNFPTLSWQAEDATECHGINFDTGGQLAGSIVVKPTVSTGYQVICTGPGGTTPASGVYVRGQTVAVYP